MQNFKTWLFYLSTYRVFFHKVELIKNLTNGLVFILEVLNKILFIKHYNDWHTVTDVIIINIKERKHWNKARPKYLHVFPAIIYLPECLYYEQWHHADLVFYSFLTQKISNT